MSKRNPGLLVDDILQSCHRIMEYTVGMSFDAFVNDSKTMDAVIRNFEVIGEAANRLPDTFKESHPAIDWQGLGALETGLYTTTWASITKSCGT